MAMNGVRSQGERRVATAMRAKMLQKKRRTQKEKEIEEDVIPLPDGVNAGGSSLLDELGEPGVINVAAEVTGFNVVVPEDGNEKEGGEKDGAELHRVGESIAREGKEKEWKSERVDKH